MTTETVIARLLSIGTAVACAVMTVGLVLSDQRTMTVGIACLITLPVLRVMVLVVAFSKQRELRLVAAGLVVLAIIGLGLALA